MTDVVRLESIHTYPVKSMHACSAERARVEGHGLEGDRRWMVVDDQRHFLSQRVEPRLALIRPHYREEGLRLRAPDGSEMGVEVPTGPPDESVVIWDDRVPACFAASAANDWISRLLERPCYLVYLDDPSERPIRSEYAEPGDTVTFADAFPVLLTSTASLEDLNRRMSDPLPMDRFRPNLVVSGAAAFAEDEWRAIRIGDVSFRVAKPCARCVITTVNQETAEKGKEPLKTLAQFRRRDGSVYFGQNLVPEAPGSVRRGDPVAVIR